jgi:hypothetical protein
MVMRRKHKEREWRQGITIGSSVEILDGKGSPHCPRQRATVTRLCRAGFTIAEHPMSTYWWHAQNMDWRRWEQHHVNPPLLGTAA